MPRKRDSLKHQLRTAALVGVSDNHTVSAYRRACDAFSTWCRENSVRDLKDVSVDVLQRYADYLTQRPEKYTAATIHGKLAPVCKAAGVSMSEIRKPKRTAGLIQRGRSETKTGRGEREAGLPQYERLVTLQRCVGIRRAELGKLTGSSLVRDKHGRVYIKVIGGKGGKDQLQFVLPKDRETVLQIFDGIGQDEPVFTPEEMTNHINLHGIRAEHAKECYQHYADFLTRYPERSEALRSSLLRRWDNAHAALKKHDPGAYSKAKEKFINDMDDRPYKLRGENRDKAIKMGLPTEYNRLALMAVSVFHLSHWRLDVTSVNYLVQ